MNASVFRRVVTTAIFPLMFLGLVPGTASAYDCRVITQAVQNHERLMVHQAAQPALSGFHYSPSIMSLNCAQEMDSMFSGLNGAGGAMGMGGMPLPASIPEEAANQVMNKVTSIGCAPVQSMQSQYESVLNQAVNTPADMIPSVPPYNVGQFSLPPPPHL